ncbi:unnamed protein product [Callosobruchus maculatus]|uniref:Uncharacterized protein n=1 Tax=Callosobruchus maculatus TaxID=64391 RepID=A0A653CM54_CALMS|nr:unnamed protein product [Callosobruchus maculatus]
MVQRHLAATTCTSGILRGHDYCHRQRCQLHHQPNHRYKPTTAKFAECHDRRRGRRGRRQRGGGGPLPGDQEVLVLPAVLHLHLPGRPPGGARVAAVRLPVLPQGGRTGPQRPQAEGAEGRARQAGVRGHLHDRGQGLGGGAHLRTDHHRQDTGGPSIYIKHSIFNNILHRRIKSPSGVNIFLK